MLVNVIVRVSVVSAVGRIDAVSRGEAEGETVSTDIEEDSDVSEREIVVVTETDSVRVCSMDIDVVLVSVPVSDCVIPNDIEWRERDCDEVFSLESSADGLDVRE